MALDPQMWGLLSGKKPKSLNKQMDRLIKNRPQYKINDEAFDNQSIAKNQAFGRNRAIQQGEEDVDQSAANAVSQAKTVSNSTAGLLDTIATINSNATQSKRDLAGQESQIKQQNVGQLLDTNQQMIDEKDKAWNFNINEPYQNQIQSIRDKKRFRQELGLKAIDFAGSIAGAAIGGGIPKSSGGGSSFGMSSNMGTNPYWDNFA